MEKKDVALVGCESYDRELVEERVARLFELMGGPGAIAGVGESVFLKVNALAPRPPESAVTCLLRRFPQRQRLVFAISRTSLPSPWIMALIIYRLNPAACERLMVGGRESS